MLYILASGSVRGFAFTLGLTTIIDVVVVFLFTKPCVTLLARTKFFGERATSWSGARPPSGWRAGPDAVGRRPHAGRRRRVTIADAAPSERRARRRRRTERPGGLMSSFAAFGNDSTRGELSFDFVGRQRLWYAISRRRPARLDRWRSVFRGLNLGIEFKGGVEFRVTQHADLEQRRRARRRQRRGRRTPSRPDASAATRVRVQTEPAQRPADRAGAAGDAGEGVRRRRRQRQRHVRRAVLGRSVTEQGAASGLVVFLVLVVLVIALYFRNWKMAVAAHRRAAARPRDHGRHLRPGRLRGHAGDVIGLLTILGYSLYDTVVVFDKVRENTARHRRRTTKRTYAEAANLAVNQTLVRSINTSVVALLPVGAILFIGAVLLGAGTLKDLALALFVGIAAGTYSSIFIATPLLADLKERRAGDAGAGASGCRRRRDEAAGRRSSRRRSAAGAGVAAPALAGAAGGRPPATAGRRRRPTPAAPSDAAAGPARPASAAGARPARAGRPGGRKRVRRRDRPQRGGRRR